MLGKTAHQNITAIDHATYLHRSMAAKFETNISAGVLFKFDQLALWPDHRQRPLSYRYVTTWRIFPNPVGCSRFKSSHFSKYLGNVHPSPLSGTVYLLVALLWQIHVSERGPGHWCDLCRLGFIWSRNMSIALHYPLINGSAKCIYNVLLYYYSTTALWYTLILTLVETWERLY